MYDSPITIYEDMQEQIVKEKDGAIFKAIMKYDIHVDKDELIKALNYDRNQYEKGYKDGFRDALREREGEEE